MQSLTEHSLKPGFARRWNFVGHSIHIRPVISSPQGPPSITFMEQKPVVELDVRVFSVVVEDRLKLEELRK